MGLADTYRLYTPIKPATTFTILSKASVKIATEPVIYQAIVFVINSKMEITAIRFWIFKLYSAACKAEF
jgi:hypothetical protein